MTIDYDKLLGFGLHVTTRYVVLVNRDGKGWLRAGSFATEAEAVDCASHLQKRNQMLDPNAERRYAVGRLDTECTFTESGVMAQ